MLIALLAGFFVWATIGLLERKRDSEMDGWQSFVLVLVPALLGFVLSVGLAFLGLAPFAPLLGLLLYFAVPLLMLRYQLEYPWGRSCAYAGIVVFYALVAEFVVVWGFAQVSA
ncbi:MAG: hypothetical protein AAF662_16030 [Pseudomonadota bacterium]